MVTLAEVDLRVGGKWRYVSMTDRGFEVGFHGVFRELVPDERIVYTEVFEGVPLTLSESAGRTTLTSVTQVSSRAIRDVIIQSGRESGMQAALDLLEEVAGFAHLTGTRSHETTGTPVPVVFSFHGLAGRRARGFGV